MAGGGRPEPGSRRRARAASAVVPLPRPTADDRLDLARLVPSGRSLLFAFGLVAAVFAAYWGARASSVFAVDRVEVRGAPPEVAREVERATRDVVGVSLLSVDASAIEGAVRSLPSDYGRVRRSCVPPHAGRTGRSRSCGRRRAAWGGGVGRQRLQPRYPRDRPEGRARASAALAAAKAEQSRSEDRCRRRTSRSPARSRGCERSGFPVGSRPSARRAGELIVVLHRAGSRSCSVAQPTSSSSWRSPREWCRSSTRGCCISTSAFRSDRLPAHTSTLRLRLSLRPKRFRR